mmetsp:Transcript_41657/g.116026  ORF Transcript_41657/g.116026 Transcript_41657/m.116026 type:complete len:222 (-) Transcript_41657:595-1260(-)
MASLSPICPRAKHAIARTGKASSSIEPNSALTSLVALPLSDASDSAALSRTSQCLSFRASEIFPTCWLLLEILLKAVTAAHLGLRICGSGRRPPLPMTKAMPEASSAGSLRSCATASAHPDALSPIMARALAAAARTPASSLFRKSLIFVMPSLEAESDNAPTAATADWRVKMSLLPKAETAADVQVEGASSPRAAMASSAAILVRPSSSRPLRRPPILSL